jgi:uncharacterized protein with PIN domain
MVRDYEHYRQALKAAGFTESVICWQLRDVVAIDHALDRDDTCCPACAGQLDKSLRDPERGHVTAEYFCGCGFMHVRQELFV